MHSIRLSIKFAIFVFSGFVFHVACHDSHRQCFDVESKTICYFLPNVSSVDWDTAWKTCRERDANLPVILNEKGQKVLVGYLTEHFPVQPVWAAGRYVGNRQWRWLNNQTVRGTDEPNCHRRQEHCLHETQAVLTKQLEYEPRYPQYGYNYICIFPAVHCTTESPKSISWKGGCLNWTNNFRLPVNKARNECLKNGGDLATFSEDGDLQDLKQFSSVVEDADDKGYLIGLHRKWWIWNTTDEDDIKFNLLNDYGDTGDDLCLLIDQRSKWKRDKCSVNRNVICQTDRRKRGSADPPFTASVTIGIVIAALAVAITAVILLIFIRKRKCVAEVKPDAGTSTTKCDQVTPPQKVIVEFQDDTYATIDLDDDLENLNYENGPNPCTSYSKMEFCDNPSAVYSEPTDLSASETNRSTDVYSDPYITSVVMTPVPKNSVSPSSDIYSEVNEPGKQKKSDELTSPPIKIGPQGDIYTLPISHN